MEYFALPVWHSVVTPNSTILEMLQDAVARSVYVTDPDRDDARWRARDIYREVCESPWHKTGYIEFDSPMEIEEGEGRRPFESGVYVVLGYTTDRLREAIPMVRAGWAWDTEKACACPVRTTNHWLDYLCLSAIVMPVMSDTIRALPSPTFDYLKGALVYSRLLTKERTVNGGYVTDGKALRAAFPKLPIPPTA